MKTGSTSRQEAEPIANLEAEQSVLGAILVRPEVLPQVADLLQPDDFYREDHRYIYQAMLDLHRRGEPVDYVTVAALLEERGILEKVGGRGFLIDLNEQVAFASNADYYARLVHDKSLIRQVQVKCRQILTACERPIENAADFLQLFESQIYEVTGNGLKKSNYADIPNIIVNAQDFIKIEFPIKKTILSPWLKEYQVIMIYGPRGVGKTMFVIALLAAIVSGKSFGPWPTENIVNCLYLDGEMPAQDTVERFQYLFEEEHKGEILVYSDAYATSLGMPGANLLNDDWRKMMKEFLLKNTIKVWVIDNIASLAPGIDENSKQDWDPINKWFLELRSAGITTIFLHHANKEGEQRGTSGREDNIDICIGLDWPKNYQKEDGTRFIVRFEKARIRHKDLHAIADSEFWLQENENGIYIWTFGSLKKQNKAQVIRMLDEGMAAKDIAVELAISAARVSQIKTEALREGLITEKGKLTQSGFLWLQKT